MVAETKETMNKMTDCMNEGFRSASEAGQKYQENWFKTVNENLKAGFGFEDFFARGERFTKGWMPFMSRTVDTFTQVCDAQYRTNMQTFKAACDAIFKTDNQDPYKSTRRIWDATFDAARENTETLNKASTRNFENCNAFVQTACCESTSGNNNNAGKGGSK